MPVFEIMILNNVHIQSPIMLYMIITTLGRIVRKPSQFLILNRNFLAVGYDVLMFLSTFEFLLVLQIKYCNDR